MKITYVMMQYPLPTQTFAMSDIASLRSQGHDVRVECLLPATKAQKRLRATYQLDPDDITNARISDYLVGVPLAAKYIIDNFSFFSLLLRKLLPKPKRFVVLLVLLPQIAALVSRLSKNPSDVVHAFWGHWPSVVPALLSRYAPSVRTSMHMGAYDLYAGFPLSLTAAMVDERFTHSTSNLAAIKDMGVTGPVHMIHRGIPLGDLSATDIDGNLIQKEALTFCTASALTKDKQVDVSLKVFASIRRAMPSATLVIIGDGPARLYLEDLAADLGVADAVSFAGYVKRQELFKIMCRSQFFLFFSKKASERLPNVVKEAMFAKCACFVSATTGIEELIPSTDFGVVIGNGDSATIANRILVFLRDPTCWQKMSMNGHARVTNGFSSNSSMSTYADIWASGDAGV